jgi:hypothetical protein
MTVAERIRKVALGKPPSLNDGFVCLVMVTAAAADESVLFYRASDTIRRMFLLFVAEAIEGAQ